MWIEGVLLEDHREVPIAWGQPRNVAAPDVNAPLVRRLQARDAPKQRGFPRPRRPDDDDELTRSRDQLDAVERDDGRICSPPRGIGLYKPGDRDCQSALPSSNSGVVWSSRSDNASSSV
jgi:hypothetical protein